VCAVDSIQSDATVLEAVCNALQRSSDVSNSVRTTSIKQRALDHGNNGCGGFNVVLQTQKLMASKVCCVVKVYTPWRLAVPVAAAQ
jgi:hypothetical protein